MATSEILGKFKTEVEPTISLASIGNGAGRICAVIDNTTTRCRRGLLFVQIKTGTTPTVNTLLKVYLIRQSNGVNNVKAGGGSLGDVDAAVSAEPTNSQCVGVIMVTATSNVLYSEAFPVDEPGAKFSFVVWNASGASLNATPVTPSVQFVPITDEAQ